MKYGSRSSSSWPPLVQHISVLLLMDKPLKQLSYPQKLSTCENENKYKTNGHLTAHTDYYSTELSAGILRYAEW